MSPEQLGGQDVDERTDIFSLGIVLAESLTGSHPFHGRTTTQAVAAILQRPFHLEGESKEVRELDGVLQRCLAKDRAGRFSSVAEMQAALIPVLACCPAFPKPTASASDAEATV